MKIIPAIAFLLLPSALVAGWALARWDVKLDCPAPARLTVEKREAEQSEESRVRIVVLHFDPASLTPPYFVQIKSVTLVIFKSPKRVPVGIVPDLIRENKEELKRAIDAGKVKTTWEMGPTEREVRRIDIQKQDLRLKFERGEFERAALAIDFYSDAFRPMCEGALMTFPLVDLPTDEDLANPEGCVRPERSGAVNTTSVEQARGGPETKPQPTKDRSTGSRQD